MSGVFFLLQWLSIPLAVLMLAVILWYSYRLLRTRSEIRATYFELERDMARRRQRNAVTAIVLAIEFCILLVGVQVRAVPFLEAERDLGEVQPVVQAPTDIPFETATPPTVPQGGLDLQEVEPLTDNDDVGFVPTPTLTPTPVGTIVANPPEGEGCLDDRAFLEIPANGMRVFQPIIVRGSAFTDDFTSAKLEISGPSTQGQYVVLDRIVSPVRTISDFNQFVPAGYEEGRYQFRLTVFGIGEQLVATCMVNIFISAPPVTATPTQRPAEATPGATQQ
jgi:hypothetical protein